MAVSIEDAQELAGLLDLYRYIQPVNSEDERKRFMAAVEKGNPYNPGYRYREFGGGERARELLESIRSSAGTDLEQSMADSLEGRLNMVETIGSVDITRRSREHYGSPGEELVEEARKRFSAVKQEGEKTVDSELLGEAFGLLFDELGISYTCGEADVDIIRNSPLERRILVPSGKTYTVGEAERLLVHESTHSIRTVNGTESGSAPLIHGTKGYEVAEEGLATFNEEELDVFRNTLPRITVRVLAVASSGEGFHSLYQKMRGLGLGGRPAFVRAYRVKRGLEDTSGPGGFIKDHIYFQGYSLISSNPGTADSLYAGKIGLNDLSSVESTPHIKREEHLEACRKAIGDLLG